MFNLDDNQRRILRIAAATAFGSWLFAQIADSSLFERLWSQAAILSVAAGAMRVWLLEAGKARALNGNRQTP